MKTLEKYTLEKDSTKMSAPPEQPPNYGTGRHSSSSSSSSDDDHKPHHDILRSSREGKTHKPVPIDPAVSFSQVVDRVDRLYAHEQLPGGWKATLLMAVRSLGVIYGDIGTSPLYVISSIFATNIPINEESVIGALSLIIWALILVVTIKYILLVLRLDNHGEGGIFALLALIPPIDPRLRNVFVAIALIGSSLVIGDGCITPAISVLSALEGIETQSSGLANYVVLITVIIIFALFMVQRFGTSKIGVSFGPIMLLWFFSLSIYGIIEITYHPAILQAFSPHFGLRFLFKNPTSVEILSTVVLCVTGVEALYADLGHFGKLPIRISWFCCVLPALLLNYIGQSAHLLRKPDDVGSLFYLSVPKPLFWPQLILATIATVIASQAMISGVFSLISQAVSFQYFPNVKVTHTSSHHLGQVYIPEINYILMTITIVIVVAFKHSANLAAAYGVAVCGVMGLTSIMFIAVAHLKYRTAWWKITIYSVIFLTIDFTFFGTSLIKIPHGGWLPIVIGIVFATVMWVWKMGREAMEAQTQALSLTYSNLQGLEKKENKNKKKTTGVFMTSRYDQTPQSVSVLLPRMRSLPSPSVFLTVKFVPIPYMPEIDRVTLQYVPELDGVVHAVVTYGFAEVPNISAVLQKVFLENQITISTETSPREEYDLNIQPGGRKRERVKERKRKRSKVRGK
eukprot:Phypoly_transcript_02649.p1 GENE.Phypoly_transcript_02649~~Phypoly_transcript_02649.p1  ORF type:complete len:683 (+),score=117.57 Phypoly_transcript_02649:179-2227(+)